MKHTNMGHEAVLLLLAFAKSGSSRLLDSEAAPGCGRLSPIRVPNTVEETRNASSWHAEWDVLCITSSHFTFQILGNRYEV